MKAIRVQVSRRKPASYTIRIGSRLLEKLPGDLARNPLGSAYCLLTDSRVVRLYGRSLHGEMRRAGLRTLLLTVPAGEGSKSRETKARIEDRMVRARMGRDSALLALGGGVIGDLGGFVAATYCRGIPFLQVPTTLLSMVDSSIGGKTGVDHPGAKNWIGAFHQPSGVVMDISTLRSLPDREFRRGLAEAVKTAVVADGGLFRLIEDARPGIRGRDEGLLARIVERCCRIKADVVRRDEREAGLRQILNFGHTIGHALESTSGYALPHGEAVSIGMVLESRVACRMGLLPEPDAERIRRLLGSLGLPVDVPVGTDPEVLISATVLDKKARGGRVRYVLPRRIGQAARRDRSYSVPVPARRVREALARVVGPAVAG